MDTVLRRSTGDRSFGAKAPLAEYTVSASYGAPAAGSSIPEGLSSRPAAAGIRAQLSNLTKEEGLYSRPAVAGIVSSS